MVRKEALGPEASNDITWFPGRHRPFKHVAGFAAQEPEHESYHRREKGARPGGTSVLASARVPRV